MPMPVVGCWTIFAVLKSTCNFFLALYVVLALRMGLRPVSPVFARALVLVIMALVMVSSVVRSSNFKAHSPICSSYFWFCTMYFCGSPSAQEIIEYLECVQVAENGILHMSGERSPRRKAMPVAWRKGG